MFQWVVEGTIARSPRPGFRPGEEFRVPREAVDEWIVQVRGMGVQTIICLLDRDQLHLYDHSLPGGLIEYYQSSGLYVGHIPTYDGQTEPFGPEHFEKIWQAFDQLPKPVLVHCSAGFDRTGRAISHILSVLQGSVTRA